MANGKANEIGVGIDHAPSIPVNSVSDLYNAHEWTEKAVRRLDELRLAESRRVNEAIESERRRVNEQLVLRAEYEAKLQVAETKRVDAIRAVDVNAVAVANERATAQAVVLANQVAASAETLRSLVAATAATVANQLAQISQQFNDRLAALEKSQYRTDGSGSGMRDMYGWIFGALMAVVTIGSVVFSVMKSK